MSLRQAGARSYHPGQGRPPVRGGGVQGPLESHAPPGIPTRDNFGWTTFTHPAGASHGLWTSGHGSTRPTMPPAARQAGAGSARWQLREGRCNRNCNPTRRYVAGSSGMQRETARRSC